MLGKTEGRRRKALFICNFPLLQRGVWPPPFAFSGLFSSSDYVYSGLRIASYCTLERRRRWHPLQCSCLESPRDGGAWWAAVYGVAQSWTQLKRLSSSRHNFVMMLFMALSILTPASLFLPFTLQMTHMFYSSGALGYPFFE